MGKAARTMLIALAVAVLMAPAVDARKAAPGPLGRQGPLHPSPSSDAVKRDTRIPGHYIVVLKDSVENTTSVAEAQTRGDERDLGLVYRSALNGYSAALSKDAVESLRDNPQVKYIAPDTRVEAFFQTTPAGIERIGTTKNETADIDEKDDKRVDVDVAILDTGIDYTHPELNVYKRANCVPSNENPGGSEKCTEGQGTDGHGHGTHVAGIAGAIDNEKGIVGAAPGARLWGIRVLNNEGEGSQSWIIAGVDWVTARAGEVEVANMSLGCVCSQPALDEAIDASVNAGVVYIVAAGNSGVEARRSSPANNVNVITVSAMADTNGQAGGSGEVTCWDDMPGVTRHYEEDALTYFSNWGNAVEIAAPGGCILSTLPGAEYGTLSGTSMASPHVAGAAALLASKSNPNSKKNVEEIRQALVEGGSMNWTDSIDDPNPEPLVNVGAAALSAGTAGAETGRVATLHGVINPGGEAATYFFQYGTTTAYGQNSPASPASAGSGAKVISVSESVTDLRPGITYHYRLVATSAKGTVYGHDRTFVQSYWAGEYLSPLLERLQPEFKGVSCASPSFCVAVGVRDVVGADSDPFSGGFPEPIAKHWDGTEWMEENVPFDGPDADSNAWLENVSCGSEGFCMAVGGPSLAAAWDGSEWSVVPVDLPADAVGGASLNDVWCASATECVAVGEYIGEVEGGPGSIRKTLIETWDGSAWSVVPSPNPVETANSFLSVSCTGPDFCVAVGRSTPQDHTPEAEPLAETWDGTSWSIEPMPQGPGIFGNWMDVSCGIGGDCMAVGQTAEKFFPEFFEYEYRYSPMGARWDGSEWTVSDPSGRVVSVSCSAPDRCLAGGGPYIDSAGEYHSEARAELWNGVDWEPVAPVQFSPYASGSLWSISCPSTMCMGVGYAGESARLPVAQQLVSAEPTATTLPAADVSSAKVRLQGAVDPWGEETSYQFEWGRDGKFESSIPVSPGTAGEGFGEVEVEQVLEGLKPHTKYQFRLVTSNEHGSSAGEVQYFTTGVRNPIGFDGESFPLGIAGGQKTTHSITAAPGFSAISCTSAGLKASGVSSMQATLSVGAEYTGCKDTIGREVTIAMNGCHYDLGVQNSGPPYTATLGVACAKEGEAIELKVKNGGGSTVCTVTIGAQSGVGGISLTNFGSGTGRGVEVGFNITALKNTTSGGLLNCGVSNGSHSNGSYAGSTKLLGENGAKEARGLFIAGEVTQGMFIAGKQSEEAGEKPRLEGESYPLGFSAGQSVNHAISAGSGFAPVTCTTVYLDGNAASVGSSIYLDAEYTGCKDTIGREVTIAMNGCHYDLGVQNSGPPYTATLGVACAKEGEAIELKVKNGGGSTVCTVTIGAQSGVGGISLTNFGSGTGRGVEVGFNITALKNTTSGGLLNCGVSNGSHSNGSYAGTTKLRGF